MSGYITAALRDKVREFDHRRCCYCQTSELISGIRMSFDHIYPRSKGGATCFENVCLACRSCNEFKADLIAAEDSLTQQLVPLFNPRTQAWREHFSWSDDGVSVRSESVIGRATVLALRINNPAIMAARRRWVSVGWHPPID